jgi:hypothetical protein
MRLSTRKCKKTHGAQVDPAPLIDVQTGGCENEERAKHPLRPCYAGLFSPAESKILPPSTV